MEKLIKVSIKNSIAIFILIVLVIAGGIYSTSKIKVETFPEISLPMLFVQANLSNSSAEEIEKNLTIPIEESIEQIKGYEDYTSTSSSNMASIIVNYPYGADLEDERSKLEEALNKLELPSEATFEVKELSPNSQPVYEVALSEKETEQSLQEIIETELVPAVEKVDGVGKAELKGTKSEKTVIYVNEEEAKEKGVTINGIKSAIQSADYNVFLGQAEKNGSSIPLELLGSLESVEELKNMNVAAASTERSGASGEQAAQINPTQGIAQGNQGSQQPGTSQQQNASQDLSQKVLLSEVAEITTETDQNEIIRFNGKESYLIQVTKSQDANTAEVVEKVKETIKDFEEEHNLNIYPVQDQGKEIEKSINSLIHEGLYGALFTVLVILLFLRNIRATLIAIVSLPLSILTTITVLEQLGYTLNIMTLGGMAVAIGRIVDDSIVVIENIYRWRQKEGKETSIRKVALFATKEVFGAITSSTLATLVVFLPLAFVGGMIGQFFRPFALSVVISILVSLIVAIILIPVLGSIFFKNVTHIEREGKLAIWYEKALSASLRKKAIVFFLSFTLLLGSLAIVPSLGVSFLPAGEAETLEIEIEVPKTSSVQSMDETASDLEGYLTGRKEVDYSQTSIGLSDERAMLMGGNDKKTILFYVKLKDNDKIDLLVEEYKNDMGEIVNKSYEDAIVTVKEVTENAAPSGNNIEVELYGTDLDKLEVASIKVENLLKQSKEVKNVENSMNGELVKWQISLNEEAEEKGITYVSVMQVISEHANDMNIGSYQLEGGEQELTLRYEKKASTIEDLKALELQSQDGSIKLEEIIEIKEVKIPSSIEHNNGKTSVKVTGITKSDNTVKATEEIESDVLALSLPEEIDVEIGGGEEMITDGFTDLGIAMIVAIGLVFLVLSVTFGGIVTPMVILSSLIFVPAGSLGGLLIAGETLSMSAMIGMLMLIGIVVTNAVVLLDRIEKNRVNGMELHHSIIEAAKTRLRPILMTAIATICALIPLSLSSSASGLISKGLAITVIGGLTTSTLLTLIFVPVLYSVLGKYRRNLSDEI
jgi:multidrug efflux pump subunit AcrB